MSEIEEFISYYDNDQLKEHSFWQDGKLHGEYKDWWENGNRWGHCFYKDGNLHGESKDWDNDGTLSVHHFYKDDKDITKEVKLLVEDILKITPEEKMIIKLKFGINQYVK